MYCTAGPRVSGSRRVPLRPLPLSPSAVENPTTAVETVPPSTVSTAQHPTQHRPAPTSRLGVALESETRTFPSFVSARPAPRVALHLFSAKMRPFFGPAPSHCAGQRHRPPPSSASATALCTLSFRTCTSSKRKKKGGGVGGLLTHKKRCTYCARICAVVRVAYDVYRSRGGHRNLLPIPAPQVSVPVPVCTLEKQGREAALQGGHPGSLGRTL